MQIEKEDKGFHCIFCGSRLHWSNSEMCCEAGDYEEDDTAIINYLLCPNCGRDYEIWDPPLEERESVYKDYWFKKT